MSRYIPEIKLDTDSPEWKSAVHLLFHDTHLLDWMYGIWGKRILKRKIRLLLLDLEQRVLSDPHHDWSVHYENDQEYSMGINMKTFVPWITQPSFLKKLEKITSSPKGTIYHLDLTELAPDWHKSILDYIK